MMESVPELDRAGLRKFGLVTGAMFVLVFGLLLPWVFSLNFPRWPWWLAAAFALPALVWPPALAPVYRVWMRAAGAIGRLNSAIVLGLMFFVVLTPFGLLRRAFGRDPMQRRMGGVQSYREPSTVRNPKSLERPY